MHAHKPEARKAPTRPVGGRGKRRDVGQPGGRWAQLLTVETGVKLIVNVGCMVVTLVATTRLAMYEQTMGVKLKELQVTLEAAEARSQQAQQEFINTFDPGQAGLIEQRASGYTDPTQKAVIFPEESGPTSLDRSSEPSGVERPGNSGFTTP